MRVAFQDIQTKTYEDGSILLTGDVRKPAFLFIHGLGTSPTDLYALARAFASKGYTSRLVALRGHNKQDEIGGVDIADWISQTNREVSDLLASFDRVFIVGFSLGGLLGLQAAAQEPVSGVASISTFFEPRLPRLTRTLFGTASRLGLKNLPRILQTTTRSTKTALPHLTFLPPNVLLATMDFGASVAEIAPELLSPVIFFHSTADRVASYKAVTAVTRSADSASLITLSELNHFMQFDVSQQALRDAILAFFGLDLPAVTENWIPVEERFSQRSQDARHWADILFRLILAFFTVFGALLFFTLEDVLTQTERASTFLLGYVFVLSLYVQLVALYFFYIVRLDVYLRHFLEPMMDTMGWAGFRSNPYASGRESVTMTRIISFSAAGLPLIAALAILVYVVIRYWEGDFGPDADNHFHQIAGIVSALMWIWALRASLTLNAYTTRSLYRRQPLPLFSPQVSKTVDRLYQSIEPGAVKPVRP